MKILSFLCILLVSYASAKQQLSELQYRNAFTNWMQAHGRVYASEEFATRYNIFKSNMNYVTEWNSKGSETVLGLNIFADITNEEYRNTYLGTPFDASAIISTQNDQTFTSKLPASVDWRQKGAVTGIKNQGECGGCWSFSAVGATEGANEIKNNHLVSLSEQQLIDCSGSYGNSGCEGGLMTLAFEYIINNGGIDTEASYPFTGKDGNCKYNPDNIGAKLVSYKNVTSGSEVSLQTATVSTPVSVAIDASNESFQLYQSGIYYESACSTTQLDHGVLVVGYGVGNAPSTSSSSQSESQSNSWGSESSQSESQSNSWGSESSQSESQSNSWGSESEGSWTGSTGSSGNSWASESGGSSGNSWGSSGSWGDVKSNSNGQYYIVKNSWGTDWGMNGYILMSRNRNNNCGIATMASFPQAALFNPSQ